MLAEKSLYERVDKAALAPVEAALEHLDRPAAEAWLLSLEQTEIYLKLTKDAEPDFRPEAAMPVTPAQLAGARRILAAAIQAEKAGGPKVAEALSKAVRSGRLQVWRLWGKKDGQLRVTRYFAARVAARHQPGAPYTRALYRLPPDALRVDGKLPTKQQIHAGALDGKTKAIGYLTPESESELHMEGSGILEFDDGTEVAVNYEGNNGYAWGQEDEQVKAELKAKHGSVPWSAWPLFKKRHTFHRALNLDEFKQLKLQAGQYLGFDRPFLRKMPVQEGVSTAMDPGLVPSGAVGLLIAKGSHRGRLIKVDDQGAAFIGRPDKIDLFWGSFTRQELKAEKRADGTPLGNFPDYGDLYFLVESAGSN